MVSLCVLRFHTNVYGYQYYTFFISNAVRERKKKYLYPKRKRKRDFIEAFKYIISVHIPLKVFCVNVYLIYTLCIKYM